LEWLVSSARGYYEAMEHRWTHRRPIKQIIGVRDEWARGNEDTGVPPCPPVGLHGAVQG
jgi:hypothetical protein